MELLSRCGAVGVLSCLIAAVAWLVACRIRPGIPRLVACLPLFALSAIPSTFFDRTVPAEAVLYYYCVTNYVWLMNCKLLAMCMNRGPISDWCQRPPLFCWLLLFPINVQPPDAPPKCAAESALNAMFLRLIAKVVGCVLFARWVTVFWGHGPIRDFGMSWLMYCLLAAVMELAASIAWVVLGVELMPHFDQPWRTTAVSEFWSLRWNLTVGALLRDLVYDPILEGQWIRDDRSRRHTNRSQGRQAIGVMCTFVASGWMHWLVIYYIAGIHAWFNLVSFCVHGCIVVVERYLWCCIRGHKRVRGQWSRVPWIVKAVVAQSVIHWIAHVFYWRDLVRSQEARELIAALDVLNPTVFSWNFSSLYG